MHAPREEVVNVISVVLIFCEISCLNVTREPHDLNQEENGLTAVSELEERYSMRLLTTWILPDVSINSFDVQEMCSQRGDVSEGGHSVNTDLPSM